MLGCGMVWNGLFWYCTAVEFRQCVLGLVRLSWIAVSRGSHVELVLVGVSRRKVALGTDWQSRCVLFCFGTVCWREDWLVRFWQSRFAVDWIGEFRSVPMC